MAHSPVIFFGCSMRGGHGLVTQDELRELQSSIESKLGFTLASAHQTQPGIIGRENQITPTEIHDRDWGYLEGSDVCIFEISNPSLGAGAEISDALHMGKPVLCLWSAKVPIDTISGYIRGKMGSSLVQAPLEYAPYTDIALAGQLIRQFVHKHIK